MLQSDPSFSANGMRSTAGSYDVASARQHVKEGSGELYSVAHILDPPSHPEMMGRIGNYDIEREVGRGGMGVDWSVDIRFRTHSGDSARNGTLPVAMKYITLPRLNRSLRASSCFPTACSGDI